MTPGEYAILPRPGLDDLFAALVADGFTLVGPTLRDGAIDYQEIGGSADLPAGWTAVHEPGSYRLARRADEAVFGWAVGPQSFKPRFFPPRLRLWQARREEGGFAIEAGSEAPQRFALIGARACDLHAIAIQDRTFLHDAHVDPDYAARRRDVFVVAVNCGEAGGTCFCVSMGTGPRATAGFDIALTELLDGTHRFLVEVGTARGATLIEGLGAAPASEEDRAAAERWWPTPRPRWVAGSRPAASKTSSTATPSTHAGTRLRRAASPAPTARSCARRASARRWRT